MSKARTRNAHEWQDTKIIRMLNIYFSFSVVAEADDGYCSDAC